MEPMAPIGASLMAVAVDGGGGNGIVPATVNNNNDTMAVAVMASLINGSGGAAAMAFVGINCAAAVDAAATIVLSSLTAVANMPSLPLSSTVVAVNDSGSGGL